MNLLRLIQNKFLQVGCWIPCSQTASCNADYYDWPFDSHECHITFRTFLTYENVQFNTEVSTNLTQKFTAKKSLKGIEWNHHSRSEQRMEASVYSRSNKRLRADEHKICI